MRRLAKGAPEAGAGQELAGPLGGPRLGRRLVQGRELRVEQGQEMLPMLPLPGGFHGVEAHHVAPAPLPGADADLLDPQVLAHRVEPARARQHRVGDLVPGPQLRRQDVLATAQREGAAVGLAVHAGVAHEDAPAQPPAPQVVLDPGDKRSREEWIARLDAAGIPCGQIRTVGEVLTSPHLKARGMIVSLPHPTAGSVTLTGIPLGLKRTPGTIRTAPPLLGQHTEELLTQIAGYRPSAIARLRQAGVV